MPWRQIKLEVHSDQADALAELLDECGACAISMQDAGQEPLYEPPLGATPLWSRTDVIGLFDCSADINDVLSKARDLLGASGLLACVIDTVEDQEWERVSLAGFQPLQFGARLWVCPGWLSPPDVNAINVILDPGLAFGTGTHPTTALCLEWLADAELDDLEVIDYGCGSGILALAAAKLGTARVVAVDNDPQALLATRENAAKNAVENCILTLLPEQLPLRPTDLVLANILAGPLIARAEYFADLLRPGGRVVLSGILAEQDSEVRQAYQRWFTLAPTVTREGWIRLEGMRKSDKV